MKQKTTDDLIRETWEEYNDTCVDTGFNVGDYVFDHRQGVGIITEVHTNNERPILVVFAEGGFDYYLACGKLFEEDNYPSIRIASEEEINTISYYSTKNVNGFKVSDIAFKEAPEDGTVCVVPAIQTCTGYANYIWGSQILDVRAIESGVCYPNTMEGRAAAQGHAAAWLGVGTSAEE